MTRTEYHQAEMAILSLCIFALLSSTYSSYLPPKLMNADPISANVTSLDPPDLRGFPVYRIEFEVKITTTGEIRNGIIHRHYGEFVKFEEKRPSSYKLDFPKPDRVNVTTLDSYLNDIFQHRELVSSTLMHDFLGINWDGGGVGWFKGYFDFMKTLLWTRVPEFQPEPPVIDWEDGLVAEFPFEAYLYIRSLHLQEWTITDFMQYVYNYTLQTPDYGVGEPDDKDVWFPNQTQPLQLPYHYTKKHPHFTPGGYLNGRAPRYYFAGEGKFNFESETMIREWLPKVHTNKPRRVLDIGTGNCHTAFAYADQYPNSEVIGIDLSPPFIRFCRQWKRLRNSTNTHFYQANAESTPFPSESFDVVHFTYVLHEMPEANSRKILKEAYRLLKPGGTLCGFEVPYRYNALVRYISIRKSTGGIEWDSPEPENGPEPFMAEYQNLALPYALQDMGYVNLTEISYSYMDHIYITYKPEKDSPSLDHERGKNEL